MPLSKPKAAKPEPKIDDPKKQKKFEKEEKEFRKKFKVWCGVLDNSNPSDHTDKISNQPLTYLQCSPFKASRQWTYSASVPNVYSLSISVPT